MIEGHKVLCMLSRKVIFCLLSAFLLAACVQYIAVVDESIQQKWLPFIEDGKTTKDDVLLKLGTPSRQFEDGMILTYHMTFTREEGFRVDSERQFIYNLVLVFDERNILQKHRMLKIQPYTS